MHRKSLAPPVLQREMFHSAHYVTRKPKTATEPCVCSGGQQRLGNERKHHLTGRGHGDRRPSAVWPAGELLCVSGSQGQPLLHPQLQIRAVSSLQKLWSWPPGGKVVHQKVTDHGGGADGWSVLVSHLTGGNNVPWEAKYQQNQCLWSPTVFSS